MGMERMLPEVPSLSILRPEWKKAIFFTDERNRNAGKKLVVIIFELFFGKIDNLLLKNK